MALPFKVLVLGPSRSHKTGFVNFLAGLQDSILPASSTAPTVGLRICNAAPSASISSACPAGVELWDVSGDQAYEATWPAIASDAQAAILLFDAEAPGAAKEVELWYEWFVTKNDMAFDKVTCIAWSSSGDRSAMPSLGPVPIESHHVEDMDAVRKTFEKFLMRAVAAQRAKR